MLPDSPKINRSFDFINNSDMSDTIAFSITYNRNSDESKSDNLLALTDDFADKLKKNC